MPAHVVLLRHLYGTQLRALALDWPPAAHGGGGPARQLLTVLLEPPLLRLALQTAVRDGALLALLAQVACELLQHGRDEPGNALGRHEWVLLPACPPACLMLT
jgi:hypothetical protein